MTDPVEIKKYHPERKYYKGYSDGRNIHLYYKENGQRKSDIIANYPFYFLIRREDARKNIDLLKVAMSKKSIIKMTDHPIEGHDKWIRIYANKVFERKLQFNTYMEPGEWNKVCNLEVLVSNLEKNGLQTYEADLSPMHRFLVDYEINIETKLERFYFDLETDDSTGGFDDESLAKNRILSFAWYNDRGESGFEISKSNDDRGEKELLMKLCQVARKYDVLCAWNGSNFDFKVTRWRMMALGITMWNRIEHETIHSDLLEAFKRNTPSGEFKSFALDNVGEKVVGLKKITHEGLKIIDMWRDHKDKLKEYNLRDAEIMYKIEKNKSYQTNDARTAALGNRFSNYFNVSTKVEGALLREANKVGIHYPTVTKDREKTTYEGGFVCPPVVGLHDGVACLDFSSLYPSIMSTYNISHDVLISEDDLPNWNKEDVITTPVSKKVRAWYAKTKVGLIPGLLQRLNKERYRYEKLRDQCEHDSEEYWSNYWAMAAHKTMILSFYGILGDSRSRFFDKRLARSITLSGQFYVKFVLSLAKQNGYTPLYGDTDSCFLKIEEEKIQEFLEIVHKKFDLVNARYNSFPGFMKVNFENYYTRIAFIKKKRYGGCLKIFKGKPVENYIHVRGLETRRSDIPPIAKNVLSTTMNMLFIDRATCDDCIKYLKTIRDKIVTGNVEKEEITIVKQVSKPFADYGGDIIDRKTGQPKVKKDGKIQQKSIPLHVKIAKKLVSSGKEFYVGSQVPYIITGQSPLEGIHESEYKPGKYDKSYYFDTQIYEPSKRLLECAFQDFNWNKLYVDEKAAARAKDVDEDDDE